MKKARFIILFILIAVCVEFTFAQANSVNKTEMTSAVKAEFLHAWTGYKKYCWGHDDLKPITKTCRDWYGTPVFMTAVDSLDSLYLL
jgi:hypothetical protein